MMRASFLLAATVAAMLALAGCNQAKSPETASNLPLILLLLPLLGSGFVPTLSMPNWLQGFAKYQPFTPFIETVRGLLLGTHIGWNLWLALGWAVVLIIVGYVWSMILYERKSVR